MMPRFAAVLSLVLLVQCLVVTASTPHPACEAMASYQAPYVASTYNVRDSASQLDVCVCVCVCLTDVLSLSVSLSCISQITKHMGFYYELAFRDLYVAPNCVCVCVCV